MTIELKILPIKTVVIVISVVWPIVCAIMFWSLHSVTRSLILLFSGVAALPLLLVWVLLFAAQRLDASTTPEAMRLKRAAANGGGRPQKP
jgi:hypothetical protein